MPEQASEWGDWGMDPNEMRWAAHIVSDELTDKDTCPVCVEHALWEALPTIKRAVITDVIRGMIADLEGKAGTSMCPFFTIVNGVPIALTDEAIAFLRSYLPADPDTTNEGGEQ